MIPNSATIRQLATIERLRIPHSSPTGVAPGGGVPPPSRTYLPRIRAYSSSVGNSTFVCPSETACSNIFSKNVALGAGDVCVDLGGSIGTIALQFSDLVGPEGQVYAFEPVTERALQRNLDANATGPNQLFLAL